MANHKSLAKQPNLSDTNSHHSTTLSDSPNPSRFSPLLSPQNILRLQPVIGNRAVQRLIATQQNTPTLPVIQQRTSSAPIQRTAHDVANYVFRKVKTERDSAAIKALATFIPTGTVNVKRIKAKIKRDSVVKFIANDTIDAEYREQVLLSWNKNSNATNNIPIPDEFEKTVTDLSVMNVESFENYDSDNEDKKLNLRAAIEKAKIDTVTIIRSSQKGGGEIEAPVIPFREAVRIGRLIVKTANSLKDYQKHLPIVTQIGGNYIEYNSPGTLDIYAYPLKDLSAKPKPKEQEVEEKSEEKTQKGESEGSEGSFAFPEDYELSDNVDFEEESGEKEEKKQPKEKSYRFEDDRGSNDSEEEDEYSDSLLTRWESHAKESKKEKKQPKEKSWRFDDDRGSNDSEEEDEYSKPLLTPWEIHAKASKEAKKQPKEKSWRFEDYRSSNDSEEEDEYGDGEKEEKSWGLGENVESESGEEISEPKKPSKKRKREIEENTTTTTTTTTSTTEPAEITPEPPTKKRRFSRAGAMADDSWKGLAKSLARESKTNIKQSLPKKIERLSKAFTGELPTQTTIGEATAIGAIGSDLMKGVAGGMQYVREMHENRNQSLEKLYTGTKPLYPPALSNGGRALVTQKTKELKKAKKAKETTTTTTTTTTTQASGKILVETDEPPKLVIAASQEKEEKGKKKHTKKKTTSTKTHK